MEPVLTDQQTVVVSSIPYFFSAPKIGDIVAFFLTDRAKIYIKRISDCRDNTFFLRGDNQTDSYDSRKFGWIPRSQIVGKIIYTV
jgi:nickel-type superoxide dismutase maturation protease